MILSALVYGYGSRSAAINELHGLRECFSRVQGA
jgi:hypothetical protein